MTKALPRIYLGTMTFGWSQTSSAVDESVALKMLRLFCDFNIKNDSEFHFIDTARIYAGGKTERILGTVLKDFGTPSKGMLAVGTKAHPSQNGGLSASGIRSQLQASLDAMQLNGVGEFYLHQPDTEHSLLESLQEAHKMASEGIFCCLGMSNYHASEVEQAFSLCEQHKLTKPTVYQGLYNPLNRAVEQELLPILQKHNCRFVAYNPLAAGLLTGKHKSVDDVAKGRFKDNPNYLPRFYTENNFAAIQLIQQACEAENISMVEATYRWLLRHSALGEQDGLLLGASSVKQLEQNLAACQAAADKGHLSPQILTAFEEAWKLTQETAFPYWRSYSSDMPNRESLDQGASYSAIKK
jgi:aflatoxin B1 aldehyde reductase